MDENNIIVRVTGEADLNEAQLQMRELANRGKDLEAQMRELEAAEKADIANIRAWVKDAQKRDQEIQRTTESYRQQRAELQQQITANQKSIQSLKQSVSTFNAVQGAGAKMSQELRAIREQLAQMEMAGDSSSQAFIELSVRAAQLTDQLGDTQAQIRILSSDTANLDAAMSVGSGVAGAFNVATSAAALLGGESEALQEAFLKVQAALAVLNGVQQVANTLNKDSVANVVIRTALQKLFNKAKAEETKNTIAGTVAAGADAVAKGAETAATTSATAATWSLNAALLANPVMLIVAGVAALTAGLVALFKHLAKTKEEQRNFNGVMEETKKTISDSEKATSYASRLAEAEGKSWKEVAAIEEKGLQDQLAAAEKAYADMEAKKKAANGRISKKEQELMDEMLEINKSKQEELLKFREDMHIKEVAEITKQNEEKLQKEREYAQRRREAIRDAENQLLDVRIALMQDGADKEIAKINLDYDRKIAAIKGNSKAEIALRKALEQQRSQEIQKVNDEVAEAEREQQQELAKLRLQNDMALAESFGGQYLYDTRAEVLKKQAELEIAEIERSVANEEMRAEKIMAINNQLKADLEANEKSRAADEVETARMAAERRVKEAENAALAILNDENSTNEQIKAARETLANHEANLREIRMQEIESQLQKGLISEEEYQDKKLDIEREALDAEKEMIAERMAQQQELVNNVLSFVSDMASEIFGFISDKIQQEMDDLDEMYTTDAEEAKENANKKYISEKELEDKKLALKRKAAAVEKAEAAFNIAMNTAMAIMRIWADVPKADFGVTTIVMTAMAAALGATQLAMVLAKPLPQYAKGRAGGKGEFAMVGERGAELMYVPEGASIVPHDKLSRPDLWGQYGIPQGKRPIMPHVDPDIAGFAIAQQMGYGVDYEKLGRTIMDNVRIPAQKAVHVNIDRTGILVSEGNDTHHILNHKYEAAWT